MAEVFWCFEKEKSALYLRSVGIAANLQSWPIVFRVSSRVN